jgi:RNA 2',3'-cyclic 3'-phosphodiesterase
MRAFIAIDLPYETKQEIIKIQKELEKENLFTGKLTEEENLHLTLKFLGETSENEIEEIKELLGEIKFDKFKVHLSDIGVFSPSFIKIIWIKLEGPGVFNLQKKIDETLIDLFTPEVKFMSHITIARVKQIKDKEKLINFLKIEEENLKKKKIDFKIDKFYLKKSELLKKGPLYTNIEEYNSNN